MNSNKFLVPFLVIGTIISLAGIFYLNSQGPKLTQLEPELQKANLLSTSEDGFEDSSDNAADAPLEESQAESPAQTLKPEVQPESPQINQPQAAPQKAPQITTPDAGSNLPEKLKNIQNLSPEDRAEAIKEFREEMLNRKR